MKLFAMKPSVVPDLAKFPWWHWLFYLLGFLCCLPAIITLVSTVNMPVRDGDPNVLNVIEFKFLHTLTCMAFLSLACLFHLVGVIVHQAVNAKTELTTRLAEQEERIHKLEAQIAAFTPPTR